MSKELPGKARPLSIQMMLQPEVHRWGTLTFSAEHDGGDAVAGAGVRAVHQLRVKQGGLWDDVVRAQAEQKPSPA